MKNLSVISLVIVACLMFGTINLCSAGCSITPSISWATKYWGGWNQKWGYVKVTAPANTQVVDYTDAQSGINLAAAYSQWLDVGYGLKQASFKIYRANDGQNLPLKFKVRIPCGDGSYSETVAVSDQGFYYCFSDIWCGTGL